MRTVLVMAALCLLSACRGSESALPPEVALSPEGVRHEGFAYSPDGKRLAWWAEATDSIPEYQLWVGNADLSAAVKLPARLGNAGALVWSPDGSRIATTSSQFGTDKLVVVPSTGGEARRVTHGAGVESPVAWFPDGDRLVYVASAAGGTFSSFVVSTRTGVSTPAVPGEKHPAFAVPSPDGSRLAYGVQDGSRNTIWVADSVGGNPRQLTTEGFEQFSYPPAPWSPDGKELVYESSRTGTTDVWVVPIDGGKPRQLTRDVRNDGSASWSADGKWVAFISDRGHQTDVWVVPAAGGAERRVTDGAVNLYQAPRWRPGTRELTFFRRVDRNGLWAADFAGGAERRLTPDSIRTSFFNISPDGKQIDYVIDHPGGIRDLAVMPIAGGAARLLVAGGGTVDRPWWSPDGSKIVFTSDRGGTYDVWVVDAAGGAPRQLENWPGYEDNAVWNADGSAIYFVSDREARVGDVWKVSLSGGEPVRITHDGSIGPLKSRAGVADIVLGVINPRGGQLGPSRLRPDGTLQAIWDRTNAFVTSISPSGDSVAAMVEQADGKQRAMILSARGGGGRVILKAGEQVGNWSKDGKCLFYTVSEGGPVHLFVLNVADGTTRRLTSSPDDVSGAELTPDGKTVVFWRGKTIQRIFRADLSKLLTQAAP